jgi:sigma-B regulation protein RsbU (phosphoserine phosphatase)
VRATVQAIVKWIGRAGIAFIAFLLLFFALDYFAPSSGFKILASIGVFVTGLWLSIRLLRKTVWRLRNRLIVTYMFIAVVPIVLIAALASMGGWLLINQLAVYLVTSELERRIDSLDAAAQSIVRSAPADRPITLRRMTELFYREHNPGIEILVRGNGKRIQYPDDATLPEPLAGWKETRGVLLRDGKFYAWSHRKISTGDVTVTAPLTDDFLAGLVPNLGVVDFRESRGGPATHSGRRLPAALNRLTAKCTGLRPSPRLCGISPERRQRDRSSRSILVFPRSCRPFSTERPIRRRKCFSGD